MIQTIIAGLLLTVATGPCGYPAGTEVKVQVVPTTAYYIVSEMDFSGQPQAIPGIVGKKAKVKFLEAVKLEGTGMLADGTFVTRNDGKFRQIKEPTGRYGKLVPGQTAAANPALFEPGTVVCSPEHGWTVTITDIGGGLGKHGPLDVFVGDRKSYEEWLATAPKEALVISWKTE